MAVELRGRQVGALIAALGSAYRDYAKLNLFTRVGMDLRMADVSAERAMPEVLAALVEWSEINGMVDALVSAALRDKPGNPRLAAIAAEMTLTSRQAPTAELESIVLKNVPMSDAVIWREQMAQLEDGICRLETSTGKAAGSGFLIGTDLVMTNRHVVDQLNPLAMGAPCAARFAVKLNGSGEAAPGERVEFAADWLAGSSPVGALDYALIRLSAAVDRPVLPPPRPYTFTAGDIYLILHHPQGAPLKVSAGTFHELAPDGRHISYTVNTEPGSSGSPVFSMDWQHVALHRAGGPESNSGVPLVSIATDEGATLWR